MGGAGKEVVATANGTSTGDGASSTNGSHNTSNHGSQTSGTNGSHKGGKKGPVASVSVWGGLLDCAGSIGSSVCLILVNKHIFSGLKFNFVLLTTAAHFLGTYAAMTVFTRLGWFEAKSPPLLRDTVWVSGWGVGSIVMMNLSLKTNSVGFYQMMKIVIIPVMVLVSLLTKGSAAVGARSGAALGVLVVGLCMATVHDVSLTPVGATLGAAAVVCTVGFQLGIQYGTQAHGLSATQLQYDIALPQAVLTLIIALPAECFPPTELWKALADRPVVIPASVALSVFLAMGVNYYCFAVIGRFSAVTYQVVNHAKTILVLVLGLLLFPIGSGAEDQHHHLRHVAGLAVATFGVILYSWAQVREKALAQLQQPEKKTS